MLIFRYIFDTPSSSPDSTFNSSSPWPYFSNAVSQSVQNLALQKSLLIPVFQTSPFTIHKCSIQDWVLQLSHSSKLFSTKLYNFLTNHKCMRMGLITFSQLKVFKAEHYYFLTIPSVQDWALQLFHSWQVSQAEHHVHTFHKCSRLSMTTVSQLTSVRGWASLSHNSKCSRLGTATCFTVDKCPRLSITFTTFHKCSRLSITTVSLFTNV